MRNNYLSLILAHSVFLNSAIDRQQSRAGGRVDSAAKPLTSVASLRLVFLGRQPQCLFVIIIDGYFIGSVSMEAVLCQCTTKFERASVSSFAELL